MQRCQSYHPGHNLFYLHLREIGRRPWGWRAATVSRVEGRNVAVLGYLDGGEATLWHHEPLTFLEIGFPVRLHEELYALEVGGALLNVEVASGLGNVPEPADVTAWLRDHVPAPVVVADLSTGRGVRDVPENRL